MIVVRVLGILLVAAALVAAGLDAANWLSTGAWRSTVLGEHWYRLSPGTLNLSQAVVQRYVSPWLWEKVIQNILLWPTWAVLGGLGLVLLLVPGRGRPGRRRRRR
jgi:hypothetical protein